MRAQLSHDYGKIAPYKDVHEFSNSVLIDSEVETRWCSRLKAILLADTISTIIMAFNIWGLIHVAIQGIKKPAPLTQTRIFAETVNQPSSQRRLASNQNIYRNQM